MDLWIGTVAAGLLCTCLGQHDVLMQKSMATRTTCRSHFFSCATLQARRLEELDRVYREEVVARKRAHNALQDAKGKIRVYCRVRPMLDFEAAKKQVDTVLVAALQHAQHLPRRRVRIHRMRAPGTLRSVAAAPWCLQISSRRRFVD